MFENLAQNREPKVVFNWYLILLLTSLLGFTGIIAGNVMKKEFDLQVVLEQTFTASKISQLLDLVISGQLSLLNDKELAFSIIDGDTRDPLTIAQ